MAGFRKTLTVHKPRERVFPAAIGVVIRETSGVSNTRQLLLSRDDAVRLHEILGVFLETGEPQISHPTKES